MAVDEETTDLTDGEVRAIHRVELGIEWLHRAHGSLLEFHHNTGHAMEHFADAEALLREHGHEDLADEIRDQYLPRGVVDGGRWSYDVVESFQEDMLEDLTAFEKRTRQEVADGRRHVAERSQEREWKRRAQRD
jgi:hypothetical protein